MLANLYIHSHKKKAKKFKTGYLGGHSILTLRTFLLFTKLYYPDVCAAVHNLVDSENNCSFLMINPSV